MTAHTPDTQKVDFHSVASFGWTGTSDFLPTRGPVFPRVKQDGKKGNRILTTRVDALSNASTANRRETV